MLYTTPLEKGQIRLFTLYPGDPSSPLHTGLAASGLDDDVAYEALSYAWDDQVPSVIISCGEGEILVTQNVFDALSELRNEQRTRCLWIDQLCINQQDDVEKSQQILLMTEIYTKAARVIIWLGKEDRDTQPAFALIDLLADVEAGGLVKHYDVLFIRDSTNIVRDVEEFAGHLPHHLKKLLARLPLTSSAELRSLQLLFRRTWFGRLWVIQEAVLGSDSSEYRCGRFSCNIVRWNSAVQAFNLCPYVETWELPADERSTRTTLRIIGDMRSTRGTSDERRGISNLLLGTRNARYKDPRDRIYALLGLVDRKLVDCITPNYKMPLVECFADAVKSTIQSDGTLEILGLIDRWDLADQISSGLPSWVPDFRERRVAYGHSLNLRFQKGPRSYAASYNTVATMLASDNLLHLALKGVRFRQITRRISPQICLNERPVLIDSIRFTPRFYRKMYQQEALRLRLPLSCLMQGSNGDNASTDVLFSNDISSDDSIDEKLLAIALRRTMTADTYSSKRKGWEASLPRLAIWEDEGKGGDMPPEMVAEHDIHVDTVMRSRTLYIVGEEPREGYLCLASGLARIGDWVCILFGGDAPFVLRPHHHDGGLNGAGQTWEFISECYVHGFMDGEALQNRDVDLDAETFVLV